MEGLPEAKQRYIGMCLTGGQNNAMEVAQQACGFPTLNELEDAFNEFVLEKDALNYHSVSTDI